MLCAVFTRPQELPEYSILWSQLGNSRRRNDNMATKKKAKKKAAKKGGKKSAKKR